MSDRWRPDHDGGDEDPSVAGDCMGTLVPVGPGAGTLDWWINHPQSPRNIKPVFVLAYPFTVEWTAR